jgi:hypothetical protein
VLALHRLGRGAETVPLLAGLTRDFPDAPEDLLLHVDAAAP